jgi:flagellar biosynthetic protein FliR
MALAIAVTPIVAQRISTPPTNLVGLAVVLIGELAIGFVFGLAGKLVFSAIEVAAEVLSFQMGFSLAGLIDPSTKARTTAIGIIAQMLGLLILLGMDGHHWMLAAIVRSFETGTQGGFHITSALAGLMLRLSADAISVGVALAAPAIVILLTVEFAMAIAGRAAPQLQILVLSFPIKITVGLWLIGASLYFMPGALRTALTTMRDVLTHTLSSM